MMPLLVNGSFTEASFLTATVAFVAFFFTDDFLADLAEVFFGAIVKSSLKVKNDAIVTIAYLSNFASIFAKKYENLLILLTRAEMVNRIPSDLAVMG